MFKKSEEKISLGADGRVYVILGIKVTIIIILAISIIGVYNSSERRLARQLDLGQRYLAEENYEQAAVAFTRAIEIDPMNTDAYIGLAQSYEGLQDYHEAVAVLEEGYALIGDDANLLIWLDEVKVLIDDKDDVHEMADMDVEEILPETQTVEIEEASEEQNEQPKEVVWTVERKDFSKQESNGDVLLRIYYDLVHTDSENEHCQEINAALKADYDAFVEQVPIIKRDNAALEYATVEESYSAAVKAEVTYADEHFLSIKWTEYYFMGGVGNETYSGTVFSLDTGKEVTAQELYFFDPNIVAAYFKFEVMEYINTNCDGQRMIYNRMHGDSTDGCDEIAEYAFDNFSFYLKDGYPVLCFAPYLLGPGASGSFEIPCRVSIFDNKGEMPDNLLIGEWIGGDHINNLVYDMKFQENSNAEYMVAWGELIDSEIIGELGYIYEGMYELKNWDKECGQGNVELRTAETFETYETYNASWKIGFLGQDVIAVTNSDGTPVYPFVGAGGVLVMERTDL